MKWHFVVPGHPGLQAQVYWKENLKMISKQGELFEVNIFLMVLGYSRMKFLNYHKEHIVDILKTDALKGYNDDEVESFIEDHLSDYDELHYLAYHCNKKEVVLENDYREENFF